MDELWMYRSRVTIKTTVCTPTRMWNSSFCAKLQPAWWKVAFTPSDTFSRSQWKPLATVERNVLFSWNYFWQNSFIHSYIDSFIHSGIQALQLILLWVFLKGTEYHREKKVPLLYVGSLSSGKHIGTDRYRKPTFSEHTSRCSQFSDRPWKLSQEVITEFYPSGLVGLNEGNEGGSTLLTRSVVCAKHRSMELF